MKRNESYSITLKGMIFLALGGYTGDHNGEKSSEKTDKIMNGLYNLLKDGDVLAFENGNFCIRKTRTRRSIFKRKK